VNSYSLICKRVMHESIASTSTCYPKSRNKLLLLLADALTTRRFVLEHDGPGAEVLVTPVKRVQSKNSSPEPSAYAFTRNPVGSASFTTPAPMSPIYRSYCMHAALQLQRTPSSLIRRSLPPLFKPPTSPSTPTNRPRIIHPSID
jgi:hypothetical protein